MDEKKIIESLKALKSESKKRNFEQKVDLIVLLKDLDLKKPDNHVDFFTNLHFARGKKIKICALTGPELHTEAEKSCDFAIPQTDFKKYQADKKLAKKLAKEYDFFIAQADIMPQVAAAFGKVLGPKGKMPNPKAGCVVPPKAQLKPLYEKLQSTVRMTAKTQPVIHVMIGKESQDEKELIDNIKTVYTQLINHLPGEDNNIRSAYIKFTMGKPIQLI